MAFDPIRGVPKFRPVKAIDIKEALSKGWRDFTSGFFIGSFGGDFVAYVLLANISFFA